MKASTNISVKPIKTIKFGDFRGLDTQSSPLDAKPSRSVLMYNLINDNGINHKRPGYERLPVFSEGLTKVFTYNYVRNNESTYAILMVFENEDSGKKLTTIKCYSPSFSLIGSVGFYSLLESEVNFYQQGSLIYCISEKHALGLSGLYVLDLSGLSLDTQVFISSSIDMADHVYIPKTTIGINRSGDTTDTRTSFEPLNMLTKKRVNTCLGGTANSIYLLDTEIDIDQDIRITIDYILNDVTYRVYAINNNSSGLSTSLYTTNADFSQVGENLIGSLYLLDGEYIGIQLTSAYAPVLAGSDNISVEYTANDSGGLQEMINQIEGTTFGVVFSETANVGRLFLSGNKNYPNYVFFSAMDDFSYFPAYNYTIVGGQSKITGLQRLSDSTLAIYKEYNGNDPTIYYMTSATQTADDYSLYTAVFPVTAGTVGETAINSRVFGNLVGDTLFFSKNGVFALTPGSNLSTERYVKERSTLINNELKTLNATNVSACVFKNRYYLSFPEEGFIYIADANYKYSQSNLNPDTTFEYEWWKWNITARRIFVINDKLYFTNGNYLYHFVEERTDRELTTLSSGVLGISTDGDNGEVSVAYSSSYTMHNGDLIYIGDTSTTYQIADELKDPHYSVDNPTAFYEYPRIDTTTISGVYSDNLGVVDTGLVLYENMPVYVKPGGNAPVNNAENGRSYIHNLILENNKPYSFQLINSLGEIQTLSNSKYAIYGIIENASFFVCDLDEANHCFHLKRFKDDTTCLYSPAKQYHNETSYTYSVGLSKRTHYEPIVSEWFSSITALGANNLRKTLRAITVMNGDRIPGNFEFGYDTKVSYLQYIYQTHSFADYLNRYQIRGDKVFNFESMSFEEFTFDGSFATSYRKRIKTKDFNYIQFKWKSDTEGDAALSSFNVEFSVNGKTRGVE